MTDPSERHADMFQIDTSANAGDCLWSDHGTTLSLAGLTKSVEIGKVGSERSDRNHFSTSARWEDRTSDRHWSLGGKSSAMSTGEHEYRRVRVTFRNNHRCRTGG